MTVHASGDRSPRSSTARRRVILLEFNELSPTVMQNFIADGHLPNFARLYQESQVFISDAEEAAPNLEPWIQWVTIHSGLSYDEHGIFHLGDGHKLSVKSLWDIASDEGLRVLVCGSMNAKYDLPLNGIVVPDPWTVGCAPQPAELSAYYDFVQHQVQEHTNAAATSPRQQQVAFLKYMATHGLSLTTIKAIADQLLLERRTGRYRWKRATILDKLQYDLFAHFYRKERPDFSTFFLNSTAHFQHMHWRNMDPSQFKVKPSDEEQAEFADAILYGYKEMDRIVGRVLALAGHEATIILSTALSQQPCLIYEDIGGKTFYRPRTFEKLLEFVGVSSWKSIEPVMSEEFHIRFDGVAQAADAAARLGALRLEGREAMRVEVRGDAVFAGCRIFEQLASHEVMLDGGAGGKSLPFLRLFYQAEGLKSGMHHPDGIFWVRSPERSHAVHEGRVSLLSLAPTILALLGIHAPGHMRGSALPIFDRTLPTAPAPALGHVTT